VRGYVRKTSLITREAILYNLLLGRRWRRPCRSRWFLRRCRWSSWFNWSSWSWLRRHCRSWPACLSAYRLHRHITHRAITRFGRNM